MFRSFVRLFLRISGLALLVGSMLPIDVITQEVCAAEDAAATYAEQVTASEMATRLFETEPIWTVETGG